MRMVFIKNYLVAEAINNRKLEIKNGKAHI